MSPEERAAYYAEHPIEGGLALGAQDALGWTALGALSKAVGPDAWYDSRLEKQGLNPESFKEGPPDPNFSSQAAAAARQEGQIAAVNAANTAGAGLVANPMAVERAPVTTTPAPVTESTPAPAPVGITSIPSQFPSSPTVTPAPAPAPVPMMTVKETWTGEDAPDPGQGWTQERFGARDGTRWTRLKEVPAQTTDDGEGGFRTSPVGGWGSYGNAVGNATGRDATAGNGYGPGYGAVDPGYRGGSEAAQGGLSTPYGFQHMARGGITSIHAPYNLGGYAAGGNPRLLRGPGDGMSDNIPATINNRQPARLADGEFVVPADVVSHLGNGSTEAGAKQLHDMMTRIRKGRTGNPKQGKQINPQKYLPA